MMATSPFFNFVTHFWHLGVPCFWLTFPLLYNIVLFSYVMFSFFFQSFAAHTDSPHLSSRGSRRSSLMRSIELRQIGWEENNGKPI